MSAFEEYPAFLLPLPPQPVQLIQQQFVLSFCEFSFSSHCELLSEAVDLFRYPEVRLGDKILVAAAEMDDFLQVQGDASRPNGAGTSDCDD